MSYNMIYGRTHFYCSHITSRSHPTRRFSSPRKLITGSWGPPWSPDFCLAMAAVVICVAWIATDRAIECPGGVN